MKRIPQKAVIPPAKPIVITVDSEQLTTEMILPKVSYEVHLKIKNESVFNGVVLPFPKVLLFLLSQSELIVMSALLDETHSSGRCVLTTKELVARTNLTAATISGVLSDLRKLGLLLEAKTSLRKHGRERKINFKIIQHLDDLLRNESTGIYSKIRALAKSKNIENITKDDVKKLYNHIILEPEHDISEEEEYN